MNIDTASIYNIKGRHFKLSHLKQFTRTMETKTHHLGVAFDQNYITPFYVLATSIFINNPATNFHIHAIISGLSDQDEKEISQFVEQHLSAISFYKLTPEDVVGLVLPKNLYFTEAAYYRLFFPALVPDTVEKMLYLDTDIVVISSLAELYNTDLTGYPVAAVAEITATKSRPDLDIHEIGTYFNSGVMLLNVPEWKKQAISEKAVQFIREFPEKIVWVDQDALNVVLQHNYLKLDGKFNVIPSDIPTYLPKEEYAHFLKNKVIIHFTLKYHKPWTVDGVNKFRYLYHKFLRLSPKGHEWKYKNSKITIRNIKGIVKTRLTEFLLSIPKIGAFLSRLAYKYLSR